MNLWKKKLMLALALLAITPTAWSQGVFFAVNTSAPTRLGSLDGPLAGTNIFGQFFVGLAPDSLVPVGLPRVHSPTGSGIVPLGNTAVPGIPAYNLVYVQMIAWDAMQWGVDWTSVPADQIGRTDIVQVYLTSGVFPDVTIAPHFNQPAIVPVPEPAAWALLALAGGTALFCSRRRKRVSIRP